ncbi:unnamed protein product [Urochloa decumbens]|uniref:Uncharacterized protein n=1 Tax=Urochloa decumbens TaxID=240449 RepID=A0ABC9B027_9POAL
MEPVMVSASTGAMNSVLAKLTSLLKEEKMPAAKAIRKQLVFFREELTTMNGLIEKLADTEDHDPLVKGWMTLVREMTYDLEDFLDAFIHSVAQGKHNILRKIKRLLSRHQIPEQLQELKQRAIEAIERLSRYKLDEAATFSQDAGLTVVDPRLSALYVKDTLVGIDGPSEKLIEMLTDGRRQLMVVPIVGLGGMGKTTLAMNVSTRIQEQFDCSAFVSVSQRPDTKRILRDILYQVTAYPSTQAAPADERLLIDALQEHLSNKRYFIVIDDVWDTSIWRIINICLIDNNLGSRVLVTTRMMSVAESCCHPDKDHIFEMGPLTVTEARSLFFGRIFGSEKSCPPEYIEISNDILKKCGGLPLAIITMASLLASKTYSVRAWKQIRDSVGSSLYKDASIGSMRSILNLSYNDLPYHLKTCLLYLSMFPEDYVIDRKRLVRRWIAEGFVSARNGQDLEEVAEHYLNELINRGLVQSVGAHYDGRVYACQVHDMILDLIVSKSVKENFVITYGKNEHMSGLRDNVRRLSLDTRYPWDTFKPSEIITSHIRSLTVIGPNKEMPAIANFRALRVLDVENFGEFESSYFQNIGRLYLLKYLRLHTTSVIEVPEEIVELRYLETVDLTGAPRSRLPKGIVKLNKLIYLLVNNMKLPDGFERMQGLRELSCIKIDGSNSANTLRDLGNLSMLRTLGLNWCISNREGSSHHVYADMLVSSLSRLSTSHLQSLYIETADGCSLDFLIYSLDIPCYHLREFQMKSDYYFPTIPKWMASLVNLTLLRINIETVGEDELQIFGALPTLLSLLLNVKSAASKDLLITRGSGFRRLKQFELTCWKGWTMLMFEPGSMEALEKLQVVFSTEEQCDGFRFGIDHLTSLKHLIVQIKCRDVNGTEVSSAAEDAIKNAVRIHRNRPRLEVQKLDEQYTFDDEMDRVTVEDYADNEGEHEILVEGEATPKLNAQIGEQAHQ